MAQKTIFKIAFREFAINSRTINIWIINLFHQSLITFRTKTFDKSLKILFRFICRQRWKTIVTLSYRPWREYSFEIYAKEKTSSNKLSPISFNSTMSLDWNQYSWLKKLKQISCWLQKKCWFLWQRWLTYILFGIFINYRNKNSVTRLFFQHFLKTSPTVSIRVCTFHSCWARSFRPVVEKEAPPWWSYNIGLIFTLTGLIKKNERYGGG